MTATTSDRRSGLSLGTRIFLITSLLIALSVGSAVAVTSFLIRRIAHDTALEALKSSAAVQATFEDQRYNQLQLISRLFATDSAVVAYFLEAAKTEEELRSVLDLLNQGKQDLGFDFAILLDPAGKLVARTDRPTVTGQDLSQRPLVAKALAEFEAAGVWTEGDRLYYAVAVPLQADFTLQGFLVTGFAITKVQADEVNSISGADVAFVTGSEQMPHVVATNLSAGTERSLMTALGSSQQMMDRAMKGGRKPAERELSLAGEPWLAYETPLLDAEGHPVGATVALASVAREMAAYRQIETALLAAGLISALLGGLLAFAIARRTLAPVRRLASAAEAARQGDYGQKIATGRKDEVGRLAQSFDELLADLREKRDMEAYVTELSRNLPEPAGARAVVGGPQSRESLLLGIELRGYARLGSNPQDTLDRLGADLKRATSAVGTQRGIVDAVAGHRLLARFEGEGRARRALTAGAQVLGAYPDEEEGAPVIALASGKTVTGPVSVGEQLERALVGLPVQQIDSLLREATPGELLLSRDVYEELRGAFETAGYHLAERRGILSPQPLYAVSSAMAVRLTGLRGIGGLGETAAPAPAGAPTISGIAPGALMGQRFEILSVLGAGGMGVVYKARDRELDDLVALKMLKREVMGDRGQLDRLKSELKLARKITHPNVLRTFDFGEIDGLAYISMEYVRGVTLRYLLDQTSRLPYSAGLRLAKQLCAGLGAAHAVGVLHRDIKPENLILEPTGNAKLMDFGIARPINRMAPGQTEAGFIVGTPLYLSPEMVQGREVDARADIYSAGVVLYEIFSGALPFDGENPMDILLKHLREPPPPPSSHWPEIPPRLEAIVLRCLAKEPDERYRSVDDLLHDLEALSA